MALISHGVRIKIIRNVFIHFNFVMNCGDRDKHAFFFNLVQYKLDILDTKEERKMQH